MYRFSGANFLKTRISSEILCPDNVSTNQNSPKRHNYWINERLKSGVIEVCAKRTNQIKKDAGDAFDNTTPTSRLTSTEKTLKPQPLLSVRARSRLRRKR